MGLLNVRLRSSCPYPEKMIAGGLAGLYIEHAVPSLGVMVGHSCLPLRYLPPLPREGLRATRSGTKA